jgi:O-antigen/teichoic acid export membrane protein
MQPRLHRERLFSKSGKKALTFSQVTTDVTQKLRGPMLGGMLNKIIRRSRRLGWALADQSLSSFTNFTLGVLVARGVEPRDFGVFGILFATYLVVLSISQAIATDPLVVRYSATSNVAWRRGTGMAVGTALGVGSLAGCLSAAVGFGLGGLLGDGLIMLGVSLPGLMVQDAWRLTFFAKGHEVGAFLNDLVWTLAMFFAIGILVAADGASLNLYVLSWGGAGTVAAVFGWFETRVRPRPSLVRTWLHEHRDLIPRYLGEFAAVGGMHHLTTYGLGAVIGLTAVGALRGAELLLGPINVFVTGVRLVAVPEGVRALAASPARLWRISVLFSCAAAGASMSWGAVVFLIPTEVGRALLGSTWDAAHDVILPLTVSIAAIGVIAGASAGMRSLAAAKRSLRARMITAPVTVAAGIAGGVLGGAAGAATGLAIASCGAAVYWWRELSLALGERHDETLETEMVGSV